MRVKLLVVHGRPQGKSLQFPHGEFVIGRGQECHVRPNSEWVSRQHCLLRVTDQAVHLRDLGSTNGTLVNGQRVVAERPLAHGDQLQVGPLVFEVVLDDSHPNTAEEVNLGTAELPGLDDTPSPQPGSRSASLGARQSFDSASL